MLRNVVLPLVRVTGDSDNTSECVISYERVVSYPGTPSCVIVFQSPELDQKQFSSIDIFGCLCELRKFLEENAWRILCNGSRYDAYPSSMSRNMGGGYKLYILTIGQYPQRSDLVNIFDKAEPKKVGTVDEQFSFYKKWIESIKLKY